ncbi:cobalamin biosynthesis protein CbiX [Cohnella kolymensis]|uniref:Cobalamin biosynthesis protein CbiX n=1 Tax=Cohnella kolymensis TaxID=1590652 RepID=A0ABR5A8R0_9BACL|nr:CbiX/SirB N-terminal domain-containing protein [Cohnella kolymensis]KIL37384.1 cobalamin biosynthesis protein CbiX [Cohnella kolymensis]
MRKPGILVISHGSREPGWVSLVDETVGAAHSALSAAKHIVPGADSIPVEAAFLELVEGRLIQDGIDRLEAAGVTHILAVPLFSSSGSTHVDEIGWALGASARSNTDTDLQRFRVQVPLTYGKPMDDSPEVVDVLSERIQELSRNPSDESLLLIGHGSEEPGFHEAWKQGMTVLADKLRERGGFAFAETAMLLPNQVPERWRQLREKRPQSDIIVVPLFLSEGYFTKEVIPRRLQGLDCRYSGRAFMPHPRVADWICRQASDWLKGFVI